MFFTLGCSSSAKYISVWSLIFRVTIGYVWGKESKSSEPPFVLSVRIDVSFNFTLLKMPIRSKSFQTARLPILAVFTDKLTSVLGPIRDYLQIQPRHIRFMWSMLPRQRDIRLLRRDSKLVVISLGVCLGVLLCLSRIISVIGDSYSIEYWHRHCLLLLLPTNRTPSFSF